MLMRRFGRQAGLRGRNAGGRGGALVQAAAMFAGSFWLLCLGTFLMGLSHAFVQQFRFAAADTASPRFRPKAISWVLAGGIVAAFLGPQTVIFTKDLLAPTPFAGAISGRCRALMVVAAVILMGLAHPQGGDAGAGPGRAPADGDRPAAGVRHRRHLRHQLLRLMNLVMTAAPLAMVHHGHSEELAVLGIQWHVLAMYAPSFITGYLIARYGAEVIIAAGLGLMIGCAAVALAGLSVAHFWGALDPSRGRLELRLHRRHDDGDPHLSAGREGAGAGLQRSSGVRLGRLRLVLFRQAPGAWRLESCQSDRSFRFPSCAWPLWPGSSSAGAARNVTLAPSRKH
jgi:hypothetical protein